MKLVITTKANAEDCIFELASETLEKFKGLKASCLIENLDEYDLSDLKQDGNKLVYVAKLDMNGEIDIDELKRFKRVIFVALGTSYKDLLKAIFDLEYNENIKACNLYDLADCYIISDKAGIKLLDKVEE